MLIPMPAMPGGGSSYAKSRQWTIFAVLCAQTLIVVMRLALLEILDAFVMGLATGFGWYAYKEDLSTTFLCYWGMMCLINGVFDLVKFLDYWVHDPAPLFSSSLP